jgi:hypothetical protein
MRYVPHSSATAGYVEAGVYGAPVAVCVSPSTRDIGWRVIAPG